MKKKKHHLKINDGKIYMWKIHFGKVQFRRKIHLGKKDFNLKIDKDKHYASAEKLLVTFLVLDSAAAAAVS